MDLIALLPWWAGIALALASYMVLHSIAIRPLPAAQSAQQIGQLATTAIWQGLATGGQYILPLICLAGAAISAVRKRRRSRLFETTSASSSADALNNMSWREFETLVGEGLGSAAKASKSRRQALWGYEYVPIGERQVLYEKKCA